MNSKEESKSQNQRCSNRYSVLPRNLGKEFISIALIFIIALETHSLCIAATGGQIQRQLLETNSAFYVYMNNPPWIKRLQFVQSSYAEGGPTPGDIRIRSFLNLTNVVSVQPSGMFFEQLTPNPVGFSPPASPDQRIVEGTSKSQIWQANVDSEVIHYSSLLPELGGSAENRLKMVLDIRFSSSVDPVRYFGLPSLQSNSFQLGGSNTFEAITTIGARLTGEIVSVSHNRPTEIAYRITDAPYDSASVSYKYAGSNELPNYFERRLFLDDQQYLRPLTNWIEEVEYGVVADISRGYEPEMFFADMSIFKRTIIETNGQRYVTMDGGEPKLIDERFVNQSDSESTRPRFISIVILFLILNAAAIWIYFAVFKRRGIAQKT